MDERLLAPCTADLLRGWTGPVHGYVHRGLPTRVVCVGEFDDEGRVYLWTQMGDGPARPEDLSLDLSLAECRDRVARALAAQVLPGNDFTGTCPRWWCDWERRSPTWSLEVEVIRHANDGRRSGGCVCRVWSAETGTLDPSDDTRLPDGSRLVDAVALAAVWREVSRVG